MHYAFNFPRFFAFVFCCIRHTEVGEEQEFYSQLALEFLCRVKSEIKKVREEKHSPVVVKEPFNSFSLLSAAACVTLPQTEFVCRSPGACLSAPPLKLRPARVFRFRVCGFSGVEITRKYIICLGLNK